MTQYDREVESLEEELSNGFITQQQFNQYMKDLEADFREYAQERADQAYRDALGEWG